MGHYTEAKPGYTVRGFVSILGSNGEKVESSKSSGGRQNPLFLALARNSRSNFDGPDTAKGVIVSVQTQLAVRQWM